MVTNRRSDFAQRRDYPATVTLFGIVVPALVVFGLAAGCDVPVTAGRFACDPAEASACPPGLECQWSSEHGEFRCVEPDAPPIDCGNGQVETGEACDGTDLAGASCLSLGFGGGTLSCTALCVLDDSACTRPPGCGDGVLDPGEDCDGANLGGMTCETMSWGTGALGCSEACRFDPVGCSAGPQCGNGTTEHGEECDDGNTISGDGCSAQCLDEVCGNDRVDPGEACDGADLSGRTCLTLGYIGGTLSCHVSCILDTSDCDPVDTCGNGTLEPVEQCDGGNLAGQTCLLLGYTGGQLACTESCTFDTSGCHDCTDGDQDGHLGYDASTCPTGDDRCDSDPDNWTTTGCASCVDADGDGRGTSCDLGLDCDDGDPGIWTGCPVCVDADGDGYGAGCALGPDCDDNAPGITGACQVNGCPQGWAHIPAGDFEMGCNAGELDGTCESDEQPRHTVTMTAYCMELTEVSVAKYRACKVAGVCTGTPDSTGGFFNWTVSPGTREAHPINGIDWSESQEYCQAWLGGDLPSEAQWEKAARGGPGDTRKYPWGSSPAPDCTRANFDMNLSFPGLGCGQVLTGPGTWTVGYLTTTLGDSPYGLKDTAGNVREWVLDMYSTTFYSSCTSGCYDPVNTGEGSDPVTRGGSYLNLPGYLRVVNRSGNPKTSRFYSIGLRCRRTP